MTRATLAFLLAAPVWACGGRVLEVGNLALGDAGGGCGQQGTACVEGGASSGGASGGGSGGGGSGADGDASTSDQDGAACASCSGTCFGGRCLVTLASGQLSPTAIAVTDTMVVWKNIDAIMQVPPSGGLPTVLASEPDSMGVVDEGWDLAVDAENAYWTQESLWTGSVLKVPLAGGAPTVLATNLMSGPSFIAVNAEGVFFTNSLPGGTGVITPAVLSLPFAGGDSTPLFSQSSGPMPSSIALDANFVYWVGADPGEDAGVDETAVMAMPLAGGTVTILDSGDNPGSVTVGAAGIFWTAQVGGAGLVRTTAINGSVTDLASVPSSLSSIAVDDTSVYWIAESTTDAGTENSIMRTSLTGGSVATLVGGPQVFVSAFVVDATSLYWVDVFNGNVMKLTPK